jgi:hypothetical protein
MAAKFFTGLPLDGPDPECVIGHGEKLLAARGETTPPRASIDHSRRASRRTLEHPDRPAALLPVIERRPHRPCDENPVADPR